jgi:serine phosphatase RsbU (regulator of sigma subunit)
LIEQKLQLAETNKHFTDSINYAQKIQNALLPSHGKFQEFFEDYFILFSPKDVVSGDFYWFESVEILSTPSWKHNLIMERIESGSSGEKSRVLQNVETGYSTKNLIALADCTGHGVPGAFMSIMGIIHLNKIVKDHQVYEPSEILSQLDFEICASLQQNEQQSTIISDGMDIGICAIDTEYLQLTFSGANTRLILIRNQTLQEFRSGNKSIGLTRFEESMSKKYKEIKIALQRGDQIYMYSDGYQDQFGGKKNKKFKSKNLRQLLLTISEFDMTEQWHRLTENLNSWKGKTFQVDDITIIGFKI